MTATLRSIQNTCITLNLSRSTVYRLLRRGELDAVKLGKATRITDESVERLVAKSPRAVFRPIAGRPDAAA